MRCGLTGKKFRRKCIYVLFPKFKRIDSQMTGWRPTESPGGCCGDDRTEILLFEKNLTDERVVEIAQNLIIHENQDDPWITKTTPCWDVNAEDDEESEELPYRPVKTLNLSKNQFGDEGLTALASAFQTSACSSLERVMLGGNPNVGLTGIKALGAALGNGNVGLGASHLKDGPSCCRIQALSLANCCIGNEECRAFAIGLKTNHHLTELLLHSNVIGNAGAEALGQAISDHPNLKYLDLSDNPIGDDGLRGLSEGLSMNTALKHLYLNDIRGSNQGLRYLVQLVKHSNPYIKVITTMTTHAECYCSCDGRPIRSDRDRIIEVLEYYLNLNQNGRSFMRHEPHINLLSWVFARASHKPEILYGLLQEIPHSWSPFVMQEQSG